MPQALPQPQIIGWETTLRCNMSCRHCGSIAGDERESELSTAEALDLCRQCGEFGVGRVVLTGGETLLRSDWLEIVNCLTEQNIHTGLLTNGWVLTDRVMGQLQKLPQYLFHLAVSIDGDAHDHDAIRGIDGCYDRAFNSAFALRTAGVNVAVITTMNRANINSLPRLREQILGVLQPYAWQLQVTNTFGRAAEDDGLSIDAVEYTRLASFVIDTRRQAKNSGIDIAAGDCLGYCSDLDIGLRDFPWQGCQAGLKLLGIRSNGDVLGCLSIVDDRFVEGNIRQQSLADIWRKPGAFAFTRDFKASQLAGLCAGCPEGDHCRGGCTAGAVSTHGQAGSAPFCLRAYEILSNQDEHDSCTTSVATEV